MCVFLLRELRRHGVRAQRRRVLLWSLRLWEGELRVTCAVLRDALVGGELLGLEVGLTSEGARLAVKVGLSVTVVAPAAEAVAAAVVAPVASVLRICAEGLTWSIVKASTVIPVPKTAEIAPARGIPIPPVVITTSASP